MFCKTINQMKLDNGVVFRKSLYLDCAANCIAAKIAASTSTLSCESKLLLMQWWICCLSGIIDATAPNILNVTARAIGSLLCITLYILRTNSSILEILSKCLSLCWQTRKTQSRRKLVLKYIFKWKICYFSFLFKMNDFIYF